MSSRLDAITSWEETARGAGYSVAVLARACGCTRRHLERYFLARFGVSPKAWLQTTRMDEAARLLVCVVPLKVVATEVGYSKSSHFSKDFKRHFGVSPRSYAVFASRIIPLRPASHEAGDGPSLRPLLLPDMENVAPGYEMSHLGT